MNNDSNQVKILIILFHGYGSNGEDLHDVAKILTKNIENAIVLCPNAPFESLNKDGGFEWFPITQVREDYFLEGLNSIFPYIKNYIDLQVKEYQISYQNVIVGGFSQGACLAVHAALRLSEKILGAISWCGGVVDYHNSLSSEIQNKIPICLIHGKEDRVIPAAFSERALKNLQANNVEAEIHLIEGLSHRIDSKSVQCAVDFITKINQK